jgi:hypothetical protein
MIDLLLIFLPFHLRDNLNFFQYNCHTARVPGIECGEHGILQVEVPWSRVVYKVSPLTYFRGKLLVRIKYFSLVNLIADVPVVPEFLQDQGNPGSNEIELPFLLFDEHTKHKMQEGFVQVRKKTGNCGCIRAGRPACF